MLQPPGMATTALPKRVMSGPKIEMLARILETYSYGVTQLFTGRVSISSLWSP